MVNLLKLPPPVSPTVTWGGTLCSPGIFNCMNSSRLWPRNVFLLIFPFALNSLLILLVFPTYITFWCNEAQMYSLLTYKLTWKPMEGAASSHFHSTSSVSLWVNKIQGALLMVFMALLHLMHVHSAISFPEETLTIVVIYDCSNTCSSLESAVSQTRK